MTSTGSPVTDYQVPHTPDSLFGLDLSEQDLSEAVQSTLDPAIQLEPSDQHQSPSHGLSCLKAACLLSTNRSILPFKPVPGLYYLPNLIDYATEKEFMTRISELNFFNNQQNNQMMFFSHLPPQLPPKEGVQDHTGIEDTHAFTKWPTFLIDLICRLPSLVRGVNPDNLDRINDLFFGPEKSRLPWQVIINLYRPGQGIEQHVDLIERFDEVILGISLGSSVAIQFEPVGAHESDAIERLYLEQRSGYIISRAARFQWTHGILANQLHDWVWDCASDESRKILRTRTRVSITIRRLKADADLLKD